MTEPADVLATRATYDTVAVDYTEFMRADLAERPLDRALLTTFAELVRAGGVDTVADLGCGPGWVTAHLHTLGLDVFGVDLSPAMIEVARREHPGLRFEEGPMVALELADGALGGIVAWYSIIHTPPVRLPAVFAEFYRTLAPGGRLLLAFQAGAERMRLEHVYGHFVSFDAYRLAPDHIIDLLTRAGFVLDSRVLREPGG